MSKQMNVLIPIELKARLEEKSKSMMTSKATVVRMSLSKFLNDKEENNNE